MVSLLSHSTYNHATPNQNYVSDQLIYADNANT